MSSVQFTTLPQLGLPLVDQQTGRLQVGWWQWFTSVTVTAQAAQQSGTTGNRPKSGSSPGYSPGGLWVGRMYFDTTLGYPIWVKSVNPDVWVNASGTVV